MAEDNSQNARPEVGLPDGHVDDNGEKVVYDYDEDGKFLGWHKEASEEAEVAE